MKMARFDQNHTKKNTATTFFVIAAVLALILGILGNYYVVKHQSSQEPQLDVPEKLTNKDAAKLDESTNETLFGLDRVSTDKKIDFFKDIKKLNFPSPLPDLLASDESFRQVITTISPELAQWLAADQLIRKYLVIANDFAQATRVSRHMSFLRTDQPFTVTTIDNTNVIDSKSYNRYDKLAEAINAIDAKAAIAVYQGFRPLFLHVFSVFNYPPDITLETIIKKATADILAAPVIEQPISLERPSTYYKFADPDLEALNPVQKQMLRMGPQNTRIIQTKLREFMVEFAKQTFKP